MLLRPTVHSVRAGRLAAPKAPEPDTSNRRFGYDTTPEFHSRSWGVSRFERCGMCTVGAADDHAPQTGGLIDRPQGHGCPLGIASAYRVECPVVAGHQEGALPSGLTVSHRRHREG